MDVSIFIGASYNGRIVPQQKWFSSIFQKIGGKGVLYPKSVLRKATRLFLMLRMNGIRWWFQPEPKNVRQILSNWITFAGFGVGNIMLIPLPSDV